MAKEKLFQVGIKALIEDSNSQILLFKSPGWSKNKTLPHWDIPGGRIQEGHSILETLKREIKEEAGIIKFSKPSFFSAVISGHEIPIGSNRKAGLVLMIYKIRIPPKTKITLSNEHIGVEWVDKKEAAKRLAYKYPPTFTDLL